MTKPVILCVDDQREVLAALTKDLAPLADLFSIVDCESADEALNILQDLIDAGNPVALIISDHVMPGTTGVDFLSQVTDRRLAPGTRKLLLTGLATHEDTIRAINQAKIDLYIAKPWATEELLAAVRKLVTTFIFEVMPDDYMDFRQILDSDVMIDRLHGGGGNSRA
jgi:two-component system chemotaxis response regulator CheY